MTIEELKGLNPGLHDDEARVYIDAHKLYVEASENIDKNGAVTGHPKTGAPMVNPYLAIRESCARTILRFHKAAPLKTSADAAASSPAGDDLSSLT